MRQVVGVHGDARAFHVGQDADQGQFDLVEEACGAALLQVLVEDVGEFGDGAGADGEASAASSSPEPSRVSWPESSVSLRSSRCR